jgi:hypothetical protein
MASFVKKMPTTKSTTGKKPVAGAPVKDPKPNCTYCGIQGHLADVCHKAHPELKPELTSRQRRKKGKGHGKGGGGDGGRGPSGSSQHA